MDSAKALIRRAQATDIPSIVDIWQQLMEDHGRRDLGYWGLVPEDDARRIYRSQKSNVLEDPAYVNLVARVDGRAVGFINGVVITRPPMFRASKIGRINEVAVERGFRRQGVGRLLIQAAVAEFAERGFEYVDLMVDRDNPEAIKLYESMGFASRELHLIRRLGPPPSG